MNKWRKYLKIEADVEGMAAVHGCSMISVYGFLQWLSGIKVIPFSVIFWQLMLGYAIAWTQKGLFLKERAYKKWEYQVREILWCMIPICYTVLVSTVSHWFSFPLSGPAILFYVILFIYHVLLWLFLKYFYWKETREMNHLLEIRRKNMENKGKHQELGKEGGRK